MAERGGGTREIERSASSVNGLGAIVRPGAALDEGRAKAPLALPARVRRVVRRSPLASVGVLIVGLVLVAAVGAPWLATTDPIEQDLAVALKPPFWMADGSLAHPLGTDHLGRDVYSRVVYGARISLTISALAALLGAGVGVMAGLVAGYRGRRLDAVIMRIVDLNLAFPLILLALAVVALLGANLRNLVIVMAITTWMIYARVVRGLTLGLREREFVQAARALGAHDARIIRRHVLPNLLPPVIVIWTLEVARVILMESALSFLGLGVPPPTPTWGRMLAEGRDYLTVAGWIAIFPGIAIMVTVLGINFLGDGLRDLLDPRLRQQT
jgi:peptide/nickel transport system permease protein